MRSQLNAAFRRFATSAMATDGARMFCACRYLVSVKKATKGGMPGTSRQQKPPALAASVASCPMASSSCSERPRKSMHGTLSPSITSVPTCAQRPYASRRPAP
eukprot:scaffold85211_cov62-Phaeocystis_antarctica.AAC.2